MNEDLQKLRIDKGHKARKGSSAKWPWLLLVVLVVAMPAGFWVWQKMHPAVTVETVTVRALDSAPGNSSAAGDRILLNATGYIMAAHRIELASKVVGRVAWVGVEMGDKVQKDQVLVRLEDDEYKARVAMEQGQLDNAKARLAELKAGSRQQEIADAAAQLQLATVEMENSQRNFQRLETLSKSTNNVSQQELDNAQSLWRGRQAQVDSIRQRHEPIKAGPRQEQIDAQQATVQQLEGSLAMARVDFDNTVIHSPLAATVLERNVEVGEFVTTGFVGDRGAKGYVVSIADLNDLRVELDINQNDFAKVSGDQPCWIVTDAYPDRKYEGVVDLISPVANRQKATVQVRVRVKNPDSLLKPDMNATVAFLAPQKAAAGAAPGQVGERPPIRVPAAAVHNGELYVVENGRAVRRSVTLGATIGSGEVEVRKGLIGGEDLVVHSARPLRDGDPVRITSNVH